MGSIKNKLHNIKKRLMRPERIVFNICNYGHFQFAPLFSDKFFLKCFYKRYTGKKLDLKNPQTFNEKLQWLKLYDKHPEYSQYADKAAVKSFIDQTVGPGHTIPTIGVYDSVEDVPFEKLPDQYVIKCTHDSGSAFICKNKAEFDTEEVKKQLSVFLKRNYFWASREYQYRGIEPRIIVEQYICSEDGEPPMDYKFFCFGGKMEFFKIDFDRFTHHRANYYNKHRELQRFGEYHLAPDFTKKYEFPEKINSMIEIAETLSKDFRFVRVDLYYVNNFIYVGEMTFFPAGGVGPLTEDGDTIMGEKLDISNLMKKHSNGN